VGYDLLAAVFFVTITPLVIAGFVLFWVVNAKDHEELASTWKAFARTRGLELVAPEGEWPNRTAPALAWTAERAELRITAVGREARVRTRLTVRPRGSLLGTMAMELPAHGTEPAQLSERPANFAQRLLTDRVMRLLLGFRQHERVVVAYRRGRVVVEWPGGERNDARLDEAMRLGAEIARTLDDEFRATETRGAAARKPAA
jgi:hypothetical protein